ncbi:hypothetical protein Tco_1112588 [Tanacetum coccineum]|uniref:Tf2-1-like SH3-like domain-containing protein n=1 Tax=Tanacetum coccineum TaxID=301880 RepID=A0ABQ5IPS2_9ASTR
MFKGDRIRIRGTLLGEMVQQAMGERKIELGMPMQNSDYFKDKMLLMQAQENGAVLDEEELLFLADECDAFDLDVDDEPTSYADMGNSNVIPYEQYLMVNDVLVIPSSASSVPNDAYVLHDNDTFVPSDPLATELNIYKEQVAIYEQHAKFELTEREQQMDDQMRILIQDHLLKQRAEDLKANAPPLLVLPPATVYPPNTDPSNASNHKSSKYWSDNPLSNLPPKELRRCETEVGPFKVLEQVESVAYKLKLPQELSRVYNMFHVSNLKKYYPDDPLVVPLEGLHVDEKLHFVEKPVEIMD